ncbi:SnoaL-like domain-containing protein [Parasphingorhabdus marina DSM 22363]|uniref:SnoaL-like domain-containing protein n=1 Tax=Parasphingorhabdus marina DSM 22363 TaxID=1123272 RepID=A0A1N6CS28_9SPHN|nr:nuclear transport factor 2 family protein [Parasphingorhabdus marina]SIN61194.1 SnoaL-like domain-containing protein [Parasphingorhabdus marina DSM 22363]
MNPGLSSEALRKLAVDGYFGRVVARDMDGLMGNISPDATMAIPPLAIAFKGKEAIAAHFQEFLESYAPIDIDDFQTTADPENGTVAVRFHIALTSVADGSRTDMHNCNFFHCDAAGQIEKIVIYMSDLPTEGFAAGATRQKDHGER